MNKANTVTNQIRSMFLESAGPKQQLEAIDNPAVIEALEVKAVHIQDIGGQETFVMSDGSYVTRQESGYWIGDDVDFFKPLCQ